MKTRIDSAIEIVPFDSFLAAGYEDVSSAESVGENAIASAARAARSGLTNKDTYPDVLLS
ncbi:MAG: hypothetical protein EA381_13590 [Planctomycetaceae bacterium]|nr:MAG: hypothetical protein EA381_13590 [Planctomycetaceae bacterium]